MRASCTSSKWSALVATAGAAILLLLLLVGHAFAAGTAQVAANATGWTTGSSLASTDWCVVDELEAIAGNVSCLEAPLALLLNSSSKRAACASGTCAHFVTRLEQSRVDDCWLSNTTRLWSSYIEPLVTYCGFDISNSSNTNSSAKTTTTTSSSSRDSGALNDAARNSSSISNATSSDAIGYNTSNTPAPSGGTNDTDSRFNAFSTTTIIVLVVGSVIGGGVVTALVVWLCSRYRTRISIAANGSSLRKLDDALLTPPTLNGSGLLGDSNSSNNSDDVVAAVGLTTAMRMQWTGPSGDATQSLSSSNSVWDDDAIVAVRIPREKVAVDALVSRGGYGEVYRGTYNSQVVAIKTLLPEKRKSMRQIVAFLAEVKLIASLEHERIVTFVGVAWDALSDLCVLTEFMAGGDLRALLVQYERLRRCHGLDADKIQIALHVAQAITYLHSLQPVVLHRDLKSKNILLDTQLNAKLTDFGVSRERSDTTTMTAGVGTSLWMAPEVMLGERYDQRADMFSFGVVLSELDSHLLPYAAQTQQLQQQASSSATGRVPVLQLVSLGRLSVQFSSCVAPELRALGAACVALDPYERPTAAEAMCVLHRALKAQLQ